MLREFGKRFRSKGSASFMLPIQSAPSVFSLAVGTMRRRDRKDNSNEQFVAYRPRRRTPRSVEARTRTCRGEFGLSRRDGSCHIETSYYNWKYRCPDLVPILRESRRIGCLLIHLCRGRLPRCLGDVPQRVRTLLRPQHPIRCWGSCLF